jgi:hypothetical protein
MKVEKLKHPFLLKAIVAIFGDIYIYIYMSRKREFGIKYSFKKIFFTNWQKPKKKSFQWRGHVFGYCRLPCVSE